mgnify:CR=1 FL=1
MNTGQIIALSIFYLLAIISGIILHKKGRPFNQIISVAHKLLALVVVLVTTLLIRDAFSASAVSISAIISLIVSFLLLISLFVSGTILSGDKEAPKRVLVLHDIATYTAIPAMILSFYLLFK